MKHLILVRHATAQPEQFSVKDFDRALEAQGIEEAGELGDFIFMQAQTPEIILCSAALRTLQTSSIFAEKLGLTKKIEEENSLYNSGFQVQIQKIKGMADEINCFALVAHNPGISQTSTALAKNGVYQLAPGSSVCFSFEIDKWADLQASSGKEVWYFIPGKK
jgi:phosphohistidine phosphatase